MTTQLIIPKTPATEQQFILPGRHSWQQFQTIQSVMENATGLKISYLDGVIELMTTGETHEMLKKAIAILLESYLLKQGINFIPVGNATREDETKEVSFEPDESYYLGEKKAHLDFLLSNWVNFVQFCQAVCHFKKAIASIFSFPLFNNINPRIFNSFYLHNHQP